MAEYIWVLAYILRFPNEPGEWAQVHRKSFSDEKSARSHQQSMSEPNKYSVCRVEVNDA